MPCINVSLWKYLLHSTTRGDAYWALPNGLPGICSWVRVSQENTFTFIIAFQLNTLRGACQLNTILCARHTLLPYWPGYFFNCFSRDLLTDPGDLLCCNLSYWPDINPQPHPPILLLRWTSAEQHQLITSLSPVHAKSCTGKMIAIFTVIVIVCMWVKM